MSNEIKNPKKRRKLISYANGRSLEEINGTVKVPKNIGFWKTLFMYSGPGALVAVGYMDPGNWSTSITGNFALALILHSALLIHRDNIYCHFIHVYS